MTNPFAPPRDEKRVRWEWPVAATSLILGVLISMAYISSQKNAILTADMAGRRGVSAATMPQVEELESEVNRLRAETARLANALGEGDKQAKVLNESLQRVNLFAGLTPVQGPGLTITLTDSTQVDLPDMERIIHDYDVLGMVNVLWASEAEAIEVNGHRIVGGSSITCVGPVIHIDGKPVASPIRIRAIGDYDTMAGALNLPGGLVENIRQADASMIRIDKVKEHRFKAYSGSTNLGVAKITPETK